MGLVDYSDSDASDIEEAPAPKPAPTSSKPTFQKVVDRSNPGKIRVSLPQATIKNETTGDEPPTKRIKTGGGAFSGFNSFLPPPKRTGQTNVTLGGGNAAKKGLGAGVSLKTGSTPGFSRDPEPEREYIENESGPASKNGGSGLSLPPPRASQVDGLKPAEDVILKGKPTMFKPLSVSRNNPKKKKKVIPGAISVTATRTPATPEPKNDKPAPRPKVSLFSMSTEVETPLLPTGNGEYRPMMLEVEEAGEEEEADPFGLEPSYEDYTPTTSHIAPPAVPTPPVSQSLDDIAGDLRLSAAERRQLFGRQKGGREQAATKVINFNTDQEYLHNEELRAAGEQVVHNPVRAIAPGKHSLKQLVNAAQSQKEALEESFAKGKSNRAEASSKYGW
ncbi:Mitotic checkpoint regulator, MAD2B-interacting domain containing protein [Hyaloscypha variabilis]